jgi:transcriptional regulator with XRE-family HTH domain
MLFGEYLLLKRKELNLSTYKLAEKCGVSRSYITLMENGRRLPGKKVITKIAKALKVETNIVINWYLEDVRQKLEKEAS